MPIAPQVAGASLVRVDVGNGLEDLGYTRNGVESRGEAFYQNVPGDQNGGDDGPPIEVIYLGEVIKLRIELTKWDKVVANKIIARLKGSTYGTPPTPGTLMFAGAKFYRVVVANLNDPQNFPRCILREPYELNKGTKFSTLVLEFEAHKGDDGVLHNTTIT